MQVEDLVKEIVDGLVIVLDGPGLVMRTTRKPGQLLDRGTASNVEIIHHLWGNQLNIKHTGSVHCRTNQIII